MKNLKTKLTLLFLSLILTSSIGISFSSCSSSSSNYNSGDAVGLRPYSRKKTHKVKNKIKVKDPKPSSRTKRDKR